MLVCYYFNSYTYITNYCYLPQPGLIWDSNGHWSHATFCPCVCALLNCTPGPSCIHPVKPSPMRKPPPPLRSKSHKYRWYVLFDKSTRNLVCDPSSMETYISPLMNLLSMVYHWLFWKSPLAIEVLFDASSAELCQLISKAPSGVRVMLNESPLSPVSWRRLPWEQVLKLNAIWLRREREVGMMARDGSDALK